MTDRRWDLLVAARPLLVAAFAPHAVRRVEYVSAFPEQADFAVWLGTGTDAEAARLREEQPLAGRVAAVLRSAGFADDELAGLLVLVQSQETVDRDYAGSWFFALR